MIALVAEGVPATEEACIEALKAARWPEGYHCPRCSCTQYYTVTSRRLPLYECVTCGYQCSVICGTIMERSRVPLRKWFLAISILADSGMTANRLCTAIGVTYKTAWLMMHKLREAMVRHNGTLSLTGLVRLDMGMTGRQSVPKLDGLHPTETPFVIGGAFDQAGSIRRVAVNPDTGGDTYYREITAQGAARFIEAFVDIRNAFVDFTVIERHRRYCQPLRYLAANIERETNRYKGWRKHYLYYLQEAVYRTNLQLAGIAPFPALLGLAVSCTAPTNRAVMNRPVPGRPDWTTMRDLDKVIAERMAYGAGLETRQAA